MVNLHLTLSSWLIHTPSLYRHFVDGNFFVCAFPTIDNITKFPGTLQIHTTQTRASSEGSNMITPLVLEVTRPALTKHIDLSRHHVFCYHNTGTWQLHKIVHVIIHNIQYSYSSCYYYYYTVHVVKVFRVWGPRSQDVPRSIKVFLV